MTQFKDALALRPGDRIAAPGGKVEKVTRRSTPEKHNTVTIHTTGGDILTTLPCRVRLAEAGS